MWLQTNDMCKQIELVGILQYFLQLKPTASVVQFTDALVCVKFLARADVNTKYPDEFEIVKPNVDDFLCVALKRVVRSRHQTRRSFLTTYKDTWPLVMPAAETEKIKEHKGEWVDISEELVIVVRSSFLGRELFGP